MVVLNNTTVLSSRDLFWYVFCPVSSSYGLICLYGSVVYWLQIGFAGNLKSRHDLRHRGTILLAGSKDP